MSFFLAITEHNSINARMIDRRIEAKLLSLVDESPAVALLGPRQVGKTTLAIDIGKTRPSTYLDLESEADRAKLSEPELDLAIHEDKLVILDEVHCMPDLFQILRGIIDEPSTLRRRFSNSDGQTTILAGPVSSLMVMSITPLARPASGAQAPGWTYIRCEISEETERSAVPTPPAFDRTPLSKARLSSLEQFSKYPNILLWTEAFP